MQPLNGAVPGAHPYQVGWPGQSDYCHCGQAKDYIGHKLYEQEQIKIAPPPPEDLNLQEMAMSGDMRACESCGDKLGYYGHHPAGTCKYAPGPEIQQGVKHDSGKPPMSLLPQEALEEIAKVLGFGESKYGSWNWAKGMKYSRLLSAVYRHLAKMQQKDDFDPETGLLHTAHAACGILFLLTYQLQHLGEDDRYDRRVSPKP